MTCVNTLGKERMGWSARGGISVPWMGNARIRLHALHTDWPCTVHIWGLDGSALGTLVFTPTTVLAQRALVAPRRLLFSCLSDILVNEFTVYICKRRFMRY